MSVAALVALLKNTMAEDFARLDGRTDATDKRLVSLERKQTEDRRIADERFSSMEKELNTLQACVSSS